MEERRKMIAYLGSKRTLVNNLVDILQVFPELSTVGDIFSGTSRCGHAFKRAGWRVMANDHNAYAYTLAQCYVEADRENVERDARILIAELSRLKGEPGYFTDTFCVRSGFFQRRNGERVDAIREAIEAKNLDPILKSVLLVSLMEAADRVDNTCGLQMAYLKKWAARAYDNLELRMPDVVMATPKGSCKALNLNANEAVRNFATDIAYIDPPYNQLNYLSNYHIWESLVLWDKPEVYGVACKRMDCRERKSAYNSKPKHKAIFRDLINNTKSRLLIVSFSDEGYHSYDDMMETLSTKGEVFVIAKDYKRYVSAKKGEKVGKVSRLRNKEFIYLVATPELQRDIPGVLTRLRKISNKLTDNDQGFLI